MDVYKRQPNRIWDEAVEGEEPCEGAPCTACTARGARRACCDDRPGADREECCETLAHTLETRERRSAASVQCQA